MYKFIDYQMNAMMYKNLIKVQIRDHIICSALFSPCLLI